MVTKTIIGRKVKISSKVTLGVALMVGVILGGYLLNMAGAQLFSSTSSSSWTYVFGPNKNEITNFNQLKNLINTGADIKITKTGEVDSQLCSSVYLSGLDNDETITCRAIPEFSADNTAPIKGNGWQFVRYHYTLHSTKLNKVDIIYDNAHQYSNGEILSGLSVVDADVNSNLKWWAKK